MITIEVSGGGILFQFTGNQHYLYDGSIEVPVNSLSLVVDESEMFTFYKAASNDIFLSGRYADLGWSKEQLIEFFKNNMVANGGGSSITEIYVGTSGDTVDPNTGVVTKLEGKKEWLCIVYKSEQGVYSMTKVNLNEFIIEGETGSGVTTDENGVIIGQVDPRQEKVHTEYDASGNPVTSADTVVLSVNASGFTASNIQLAIDAKTEKAFYDSEYVWDSTEQKMKLKYYNQKGDLVDFIDLFDTFSNGDIMLPNRTF